MDYLREMNRKPLKDEILLQGFSCWNPIAVKDSHYHTLKKQQETTISVKYMLAGFGKSTTF
jgi:hypothetical protein